MSSNNKIHLKWREEYIDCDTAGCSGGEYRKLTIQREGQEDKVLHYDSHLGGEGNVNLYNVEDAVMAALEALGFEVSLEIDSDENRQAWEEFVNAENEEDSGS